MVDGGSSDGTEKIAERHGARVVASALGRGIQLSEGASRARGRWLLFLHADTVPGEGWSRAVSGYCADPANRERAAAFRFALDDTAPAARRLEAIVAWRTAALGLPYGDQGLLISRAFYESLGGYRPLPLMEDVDFVRRIGRRRLDVLDVAAVTVRGPLPEVRLSAPLRPQPDLPRALFPRRPARRHRAHLPMRRRPRLYVFVRAPVLGAVKRRLAAGIGAVEALRFYRAATDSLLRRVGRDPRWETVLAVTPDWAAHGVSPWPARIVRTAQGGGDLGARMGRILARDPAVPVAIVGSDIPELGARHVGSAFAALRSADLVFGPAADGGYWLVGRRAGAANARPVRRRPLVEPARPCRYARERACPPEDRHSRNAGGCRRRRVLREVADQAERPARCSLSRGISSTKLQGLCRTSSW